jgi:hypothetical protein
MLMVSLLVGASGFLTFAAAPVCATEPVVVPVSKTPSVPDAPKDGARLPDVGPKSREPAVLLPGCKAEPRTKRRKRLSDYPMA